MFHRNEKLGEGISAYLLKLTPLRICQGKEFDSSEFVYNPNIPYSLNINGQGGPPLSTSSSSHSNFYALIRDTTGQVFIN